MIKKNVLACTALLVGLGGVFVLINTQPRVVEE